MFLIERCQLRNLSKKKRKTKNYNFFIKILNSIVYIYYSIILFTKKVIPKLCWNPKTFVCLHVHFIIIFFKHSNNSRSSCFIIVITSFLRLAAIFEDRWRLCYDYFVMLRQLIFFSKERKWSKIGFHINFLKFVKQFQYLI